MNSPAMRPSLLRPVRSFLRKTLIRRRMYAPCCASCGEMPMRLEKRLCASLPAVFPVDAVLVPVADGAGQTSTFTRSITGLQRHCPWLRLLFLAMEGDELPEISHAPDNLRPIRRRDFPLSSTDFAPVYAAHDLPGLSEQYLLVQAGSTPERDMLPLDFFTPNGIPYLLLEAAETDPASLPSISGIFAQTRANSADFPVWLSAQGGAVPSFADCREYYTAIGRWAYFSGRSVPLYR
jgi:hypothetical protein